MQMRIKLLENISRILSFDKAQLETFLEQKRNSSQKSIQLNEHIATTQKHIEELEAVFEAVKSGKITCNKTIDALWLEFAEELKLCQDLSGKLDLPSKAKLFD